MLYEQRRYEISPGMTAKLDDRFRKHTIRIMRRHGHRVVGVWLPVIGSLTTLTYLLAWTDMAERDRCCEAFDHDDEWHGILAATLGLTTSRSSELWTAADYAPQLQLVWPDGTVQDA